jgi:hypothetical protein
LLGEGLIRPNESDGAIEDLNEAIQILKEVGNPRQLWQACASLAAAFDKIERATEGREQWGAAAEEIHNLARGLSNRALREAFLQAESIRGILLKAEEMTK